MDFAFSAEQELLRAAARDYLADRFAAERVVALAESDGGLGPGELEGARRPRLARPRPRPARARRARRGDRHRAAAGAVVVDGRARLAAAR